MGREDAETGVDRAPAFAKPPPRDENENFSLILWSVIQIFIVHHASQSAVVPSRLRVQDITRISIGGVGVKVATKIFTRLPS